MIASLYAAAEVCLKKKHGEQAGQRRPQQQQQQQQQLVQRKGHQQWNQGDRVQAGLVPATTDLRWLAGLQAAADLRCLSPHRSYIRTLPPASQLRESLCHFGSRAPEKSDRLRYANITQGPHRRGLSPTGIGLHPGPGLFGGHLCSNPGRRLLA